MSVRARHTAATLTIRSLYIADICARYARGAHPANIFPNLAAGSNNSEIVTPTASSVQPGSWVLSTPTLDSSGRASTPRPSRRAKAATQPRPARPYSAGSTSGPDHLLARQPLLALQWEETAIFLGLAAILAAACLWRIRRQAFRAAAAMRSALIVDVPYGHARAGFGRRR